MGIKWLDKSHRSPVSCKEISREQVANRLQSRFKQGLRWDVTDFGRDEVSVATKWTPTNRDGAATDRRLFGD